MKVMGPDGGLITSQEVAVGSTYGIEGIAFGRVSVEASSGCTANTELTAKSPSLRMVIDGESCTLFD